MNANELKQRFPNASEAFLIANTDKDSRGRIPSANSEPVKGKPLERPVSGEKKSRTGVAHSVELRCRLRIRFTVYAVRPCDWDGYHIKELQDLCVKAGIMDGDEWNLLQGEIISEKVHSKEEEKTVIEIFQLAEAVAILRELGVIR